MVGTIRAELAEVRSDLSSTAGNLSRLRSDSLYDEVRKTNIELKGLIADIKAHPDRYVKVRFSLFK